MVNLFPETPGVLIGCGLGALPGLIAMDGAGPDENDEGVEGPGGDEAAETEVDIDVSLRRGAMVCPNEVA